MAVPVLDILHEDQTGHPPEVLISVPPCRGKEPGSQGAGVGQGRSAGRSSGGTFSHSQRQGLLSGKWLCVLDSPRAPESRGCPRLWEQARLCPPGTWGWPWARGACRSLRAACPFLLQGHTLPSGLSGAPAEVAGGARMVPKLDQPLPGRLAWRTPGSNLGGEVALGLEQRVNFPIRTPFQRFQLRL